MIFYEKPLLRNILSYLPVSSLKQSRQVSHLWHDVGTSQILRRADEDALAFKQRYFDYVAAHPEIYTTFLDVIEESGLITTWYEFPIELISRMIGPAANISYGHANFFATMAAANVRYHNDDDIPERLIHAYRSLYTLTKSVAAQDKIFNALLDRAKQNNKTSMSILSALSDQLHQRHVDPAMKFFTSKIQHSASTEMPVVAAMAIVAILRITKKSKNNPTLAVEQVKTTLCNALIRGNIFSVNTNNQGNSLMSGSGLITLRNIDVVWPQLNRQQQPIIFKNILDLTTCINVRIRANAKVGLSKIANQLPPNMIMSMFARACACITKTKLNDISLASSYLNEYSNDSRALIVVNLFIKMVTDSQITSDDICRIIQLLNLTELKSANLDDANRRTIQQKCDGLLASDDNKIQILGVYMLLAYEHLILTDAQKSKALDAMIKNSDDLDAARARLINMPMCFMRLFECLPPELQANAELLLENRLQELLQAKQEAKAIKNDNMEGRILNNIKFLLSMFPKPLQQRLAKSTLTKMTHNQTIEKMSPSEFFDEPVHLILAGAQAFNVDEMNSLLKFCERIEGVGCQFISLILLLNANQYVFESFHEQYQEIFASLFELQDSTKYKDNAEIIFEFICMFAERPHLLQEQDLNELLRACAVATEFKQPEELFDPQLKFQELFSSVGKQINTKRRLTLAAQCHDKDNEHLPILTQAIKAERLSLTPNQHQQLAAELRHCAVRNGIRRATKPTGSFWQGIPVQQPELHQLIDKLEDPNCHWLSVIDRLAATAKQLHKSTLAREINRIKSDYLPKPVPACAISNYRK